MSIQINNPDLSGLTAIAGHGPGNFSINPTGALGLQAIQTAASTSAARRQAELERMRLGQQGMLGLGQQRIQMQQLDQQGELARQQAALEQQKMAQQGSQFERGYALDTAKLNTLAGHESEKNDIEKQKLAMEAQSKMMANLVDMDKQDLHKRGSFASYGLIALNGAKTPEEAQQIKLEILKEAVSKKYIPSAQAESMLKMPLSQTKGAFGQYIIAAGLAKDHQKLNDTIIDKPENKSGIHIVEGADGSRSISIDPTTPIKTDTMKGLKSSSSNLTELQNILDNVPSSFFGAPALKQSATWVREWAEKAPIIGKIIKPSLESKNELDLYTNLQGATKNLAMNVIKELSGLSYTDRQLEFMVDIVPSIGPTTVESEFQGKSRNLLRFFNQVKQDSEQLLSQGFKINSPEYKNKLLEKMQSAAGNINNTDLFSQYRSHPDYADWSDKEIRDALEAKAK